MKKNLLLGVALLTFFGVNAQQANQSKLVTNQTVSQKAVVVGSNAKSATATCGSDTVAYARNIKSAGSFAGYNAKAGFIEWGQYYDAPQSLEVSAVKFFANKKHTGTTTATINIFEANADSTPGTLLATKTVNVDSIKVTFLDDIAKVAVFATPVTITTPYVITYASADTTIFYSTKGGEGKKENLAKINYMAAGFANALSLGLDMDCVLEPAVTYSITSSFTATTNGDTTTFTNTSSPILFAKHYNLEQSLTKNHTFTWNFGDGGNDTIINKAIVKHKYATKASYSVALSDTIENWSLVKCSDVATNSISGISKLAAFNALSIYPNPSTGMFTISNGNTRISYIEIFDILGNKVLRSDVNNEVAKFDLSGNAKGIYFVRIATNSGITTQKITLTK